MSPHNERLDNTYVQKYYDAQLQRTPGMYEQSRWHASAVRRFEYRQTERALKYALKGMHHVSAIEIGPGSAVWTPHICEVADSVHLIEQSGEMLTQAREKLGGDTRVTFEHADASAADVRSPVDLVVAVRCFEYFEDKQQALAHFRSFLKPHGRLVIITKNAGLWRRTPLHKKALHSDQKTYKEMVELLRTAGFSVAQVYPAVVRLGADYAVARFAFDLLHRLLLLLRRLPLAPAFSFVTESYVYVANKKGDY